METKIHGIRRKILTTLIHFSISSIICFFSCKQEKKQNEFILLSTVYKLEIPAFSPPYGEVALTEQINIIYAIKSKRRLNSNDIFVEKTNNLFDTLTTIVCTDTVCKSEYFYECYSNKYINVIYKPHKLKDYYNEIKDIAKTVDLIFNSDTLKKSDDYKEYFITEMNSTLSNKRQIYDVDNW